MNSEEHTVNYLYRLDDFGLDRSLGDNGVLAVNVEPVTAVGSLAQRP